MSAASSPPEDSALRAIAAQWTIRRDRGLSASESIDYELWLAADPRHAAAMQRTSAAWSLLDRIPESAAAPVLDAATHRRLSMAFEARQVQKAYHALVAGHVSGVEGLIDRPLRKEALGSAKQIVCHEQGRPSQTRWRVEARLDAVPASVRATEAPFPCTLLRLEPLTGRSHQLRVHLLSLGHAILGDNLYAAPDALAAATRLCLHATELSFEGTRHTAPHPF